MLVVVAVFSGGRIWDGMCGTECHLKTLIMHLLVHDWHGGQCSAKPTMRCQPRTLKQNQKRAATYFGTRSSPVEHNNAAKDSIFGPISRHVGKAVGVLVVVHVLHMAEEHWPGFDGWGTGRAIWADDAAARVGRVQQEGADGA